MKEETAFGNLILYSRKVLVIPCLLCGMSGRLKEAPTPPHLYARHVKIKIFGA